jgi:hypothetical protein
MPDKVSVRKSWFTDTDETCLVLTGRNRAGDDLCAACASGLVES